MGVEMVGIGVLLEHRPPSGIFIPALSLIRPKLYVFFSLGNRVACFFCSIPQSWRARPPGPSAQLGIWSPFVVFPTIATRGCKH